MRDSDLAYERLRMMIVTAELKPGQVIVESEIIKQFGMGRTPVREALNRLSWEQFVRIIPRQCIMVSEMPVHELESVYQMRYTLSALEGELAAARRTEEDLRRLRQMVENIKHEPVAEKRVMLDRKFHQIISSMTKNSFLEREMNVFMDLSLRLLFVYQEHLGSIDDTVIDEYEDMYSYIERQDAENLTRMLQQHVLSFHNKFLNHNMLGAADKAPATILQKRGI